jgi:hypothetical protein
MNLIEKQGNLFDLEDTHYLVHCVSADFALGKGIAKEFDKRYSMRLKLLANSSSGECILIGNVFNLITKDRYWHKPTYQSLRQSLEVMKVLYSNISGLTNTTIPIAMPKIGCGLDKLDWSKVRSIIEDIFEDVDCEIVVMYLEEKSTTSG